MQWHNQDAVKQLAPGEIHIWLNFLNLHQAKLKHLYPLLSAAEKARSEEFSHFRARKNYIASHGFLHSVLAYYLECPAAEIEFSQGEKGKPFILPEQNPQQIQFNLSHSQNLAILAVCREQSVGIDIECSQRDSDWSGIARRFFTPHEQQALFALPEAQQKDAFYRVWTRKEAHMKVTGLGLALPPTWFEVSVPPQAAAFIGLQTPQAGELFAGQHADHYQMQDIQLPEAYPAYHACLSANFEFTRLKNFIHN
ncbi:MAG TPA: 4'-phosphopantetheinyl transferase superfamily protein [Gammaproteobacteria bacterium]